MAQTIRELIAELSAIENQDQPIFSVWYVADDFEFGDNKPTPTPEQFGEILNATNLDWTELSEQISDEVYDFMHKYYVCHDCDNVTTLEYAEEHDYLCENCHETKEDN